MKPHHFFILLCLAFVFTSCVKNEDLPEPTFEYVDEPVENENSDITKDQWLQPADEEAIGQRPHKYPNKFQKFQGP